MIRNTNGCVILSTILFLVINAAQAYSENICPKGQWCREYPAVGQPVQSPRHKDIFNSITGDNNGNTISTKTSTIMANFNGSWEEIDSMNESRKRLGRTDDGTVLMTTGYNIYYLESDKWIIIPQADRRFYVKDMWGTDLKYLVAVGRIEEKGAIYHYINGAWHPWKIDVSEVSNDTINAVWGNSKSEIFAAGRAGIFRFNGTDWSLSLDTRDTPDSFNDVWGSDRNNILAVGDRGTIVHYNGEKWTKIMGGQFSYFDIASFKGVWGSSRDDVYVVGGVIILHYDGTIWHKMEPGKAHNIQDIWGTTGNDIYIAASTGIFRLDNSLKAGESGDGNISFLDNIWSLLESIGVVQ